MAVLRELALHSAALAVGVLLLGAAAAVLGRWLYAVLRFTESIDGAGRQRRRRTTYVANEHASDTIEQRLRAARRQMETDARVMPQIRLPEQKPKGCFQRRGETAA